MKILMYKGLGFVSRAIQVQTRSPYSHVGIQFSDGAIIEAWHTGGKWPWHGTVRMIGDPWEGHDPRTPIDVFELAGEYNEASGRLFAERQIGKKYDFRSVWRFMSRRNAPANDDRWFCSELGVVICRKALFNILNGNAAHMSPRDVAMSPMLEFSHTEK